MPRGTPPKGRDEVKTFNRVITDEEFAQIPRDLSIAEVAEYISRNNLGIIRCDEHAFPNYDLDEANRENEGVMT